MLAPEFSRHPAFRASILHPPRPEVATEDWHVEIQPLGNAVERSHLQFSHAEHLDVSRVRNDATGTALQCADCHRLSRDGEHFEKVTMANQCASCHELTFDPLAPNRELPHGKTLEVAYTMQEYFIRRYTDPAAAVRLRERRRLPDSEPVTDECPRPPLARAKKRAADEIVRQFSKDNGCDECHVVDDAQSAVIEKRFTVRPVRMTGDYFPASRFQSSQARDPEGPDG